MGVNPSHVRDWRELAQRHRFQAELLARFLGVSRRTLHRFFQKHFALSPAVWLEREREQLARELVVAGELSIKEIADVLGYSSASVFCRAFRRINGMSPQAFLHHVRQSTSFVPNSTSTPVAVSEISDGHSPPFHGITPDRR